MKPLLVRRGPLDAAAAVAAACALAGLVVGLVGGAAGAAAQQEADPLSPRTIFVVRPDGSTGAAVRGAAIPNIDSVKATIRTYYAANRKGLANRTASPYISEVGQLLSDLTPFLNENATLYGTPVKLPNPTYYLP